MHTVGREYATAHGVTLGSLMDVLPQTNEPGCSAGFAQGLITGIAPEIHVSRPQASAAVCHETTTRYQRYSCVHGFGHWLGKVLAVVTNGEFERLGCPAAPSERARRACVQGARATDGALETFS